MVQLHDNLGKLHQAGLQIVGISPDSVEILKKFSDSKKISFPLLSDEGSKTIRAYGLHFKRGLPHPGTIVVDQQGVIRAKLFEDGYVDRHSVDELLKVAEQLK